MCKDNHFIIIIRDEKNRTLEFERFRLKTEKASYKSFLKFINSYGLDKYISGFNKGGKPEKVVCRFLEFDPYQETHIFEKTFNEFLEDLENNKK